MNPLTTSEKNAFARKHREKVARQVAKAVEAPSVDSLLLVADKLSRNDLRSALVPLAEKLGLVEVIKHLYAALPAPERAIPDVPKAIPGDSPDDQPKSLALPRPAFKSTPESRLATVYARPHNPRQRLIEFADDKTHGTLWVQYDSPVWNGWTIWAKKNTNLQQGGYILDGTYSWRGMRLK